MTIKEFIEHLKSLNFYLAIENDKLVLKGDREKLSAEELGSIRENTTVINYIRKHKDELVEHISNTSRNERSAKDITSVYPLSPLQEGMLFHSLYDHEAGTYVEQFSCELLDADTGILLQSWDGLLQRHTILRSSFHYDEFSIPVQCVHSEVKLRVEWLDYRDMPADTLASALDEYRSADRQRSFDLKSAPLMRLALIRLSANRHYMLWSWHHILADGWSMPILVSELLGNYETLMAGKRLPPAQEDRFEEYIRYIGARDKEQEENFWRSYMAPVQEPTLLPFIRSDQRNKGAGTYRVETLVLHSTLAGSLESYAQQHHLTLNTVMQGVWSLLLHRYTGLATVSYGVTVSGRPESLQDVESRVGLYINTLPLRTNYDPQLPVASWLRSLQQEQIESREYQYASLGAIQKWAGVQGDLFDSLLVFENYPVIKKLSSQNDALKAGNVQVTEQTNYPLTIVIVASEEITVSFSYNASLMQEEQVQRIKKHFEQVLTQIADLKVERLKEVDLLNPDERRRLLFEFNDTDAGYPKDETIVDLFEEQVRRTPGHTAVVFEDRSLTYKELNEQSNQLAHYLRKNYAVQSDDLIAVLLPRSEWMIVALLAVLKSGGAYVPIDPEYPADRISFMIEDSGCKLVLDEEELKKFREQQHEFLVSDSEHLTAPSHLAYVIYTSGTTGRPKGTLIEHRNVVRLMKNDRALFDFTADDVWTLFHSFCFDFSVWEMYGALLFGGKLVVVPSLAAKDPAVFVDLLAHHKVTVLNQTPSSFYNVLSAELKRPVADLNLRYVIFGGEALSPSRLKECKERYPSTRLVNMYGITETTVHVTFKEVGWKEIEAGISNIGSPIPTLRCYVLDEVGSLCAVGVPGELYVGGAGVARGYLNRDELTAQKFLSSPFQEGERLYRSGDKARWLPGGELEYLGRIDEQVKIRGYRIELGEIENALLAHEAIKETVVVAREQKGDRQLAAYYVVYEQDPGPAAMRTWLQQKLPSYMVPSYFVPLENIPLTSNGKIDRKALPQPEASLMVHQQYTAPRNETEEKLAAIWKKLLEIDRPGIYDNFFELGGHSLSATRAISAIRKTFSIEVSIRDLFDHPTIARLSDFMATLDTANLMPEIKAGSRPADIPLSFAQERLWFIDKLEGSVHYHIPGLLRLKGDLHVQYLEDAFKTIVNRHEVLRTVLVERQGTGYQQVMDEDLWRLEQTSAPQNSNDFITEYVNRPFDLSSDHLLRACLVPPNGEEHLLIIVLHHIAADGWSMPLLVSELQELYSAAVQQRKPHLPELPVQYADYALWQRNYLQGDVLEQKLDYWQKQLEGVTPLQLPTDRPRPAIQTTRGHSLHFHIEEELRRKLVELSQQEGCTLFMTLLSVFKVLLHRYSGQQDICVGSPIAGRTQKALEPLIGFFVNTLALRSRVEPEVSFRQLLSSVRSSTLEAYGHQDVPFEKIVERVEQGRDRSRTPVFQVMFVLQNNVQAEEVSLAGVELRAEAVAAGVSKFDLTVHATERGRGIDLVLEYNTDLFFEESMKRMADHFRQLLRAVVDDPAQPVGRLKMLSAAEERQVLVDFNNTAAAYPKDKTIIDLFEEQVRRTPDATAIMFEERSLTYKELNEQSNRLAHYLRRNYSVQPDDLIAVLLPRSEWMIVTLLAVLKSGGGYVPIDPEYPADRIRFMIEDSGCKLVINEEELKRFREQEDEFSLSDPEPIAAPSHLAYVIYTSGTTGRPKGTLIEHRNLVHSTLPRLSVYSAMESFLLMSSIGFDSSVAGVFGTLCCGARLCLTSKGLLSDARLLAAYLAEQRITHLLTVPSYYQLLLMELEHRPNHLRQVIVAGEHCSSALVERHFAAPALEGCELFNEYGPTEATVWSSVHRYGREEEIAETIGRPLPNTKIYIMESSGLPAAIGIAGELWIGGGGVGRGYLNREELTAERFIKSPFREGDRLYRSGDLGYWKADGTIGYLGRMDEQVKLRGYRIELGEIENTLLQEQGVKEAVVVVRGGQLVAYCTSKAEGQEDGNRIWMSLQGKLPEYMVPAHYVWLKELPLNAHGKVDKKALPDVEASANHRLYEAPRTETEARLAELWEELLGLQRIGIHDNFFELGGHSLLVTRLVSAIRQQLSTELAIRDLFNHPTIARLSEFMATLDTANLMPEIKAGARPADIPLSFAQERLWFIDKLEGSVHYHIPGLLRLNGDLHVQYLEDAFKTIVNRHEVLRTVLVERQGIGYQQVMDQDLWRLEHGSALHNSNDFITEYVNRPFDLSSDHLLRACLVPANGEEHLLIIVLHHIAADGWSMPLLVSELQELYSAAVQQRKPHLPELPVQYADYALWQRNYLQGAVLEQKLDYWQKQLEGVTPLQLPTDRPRPAIQSTRGHSLHFHVEEELRRKLVELSQQEGCTLFMTLLSVFKVLLHRYSGQQDICVGSPIAGRTQKALEPLIGFFVNTLALRSRVEPEVSFRQLLSSVRSSTLEAYGHQDVPFEKIVERVEQGRDRSRTPVFQVMLVLQNNVQAEEVSLAGVELRAEAVAAGVSKFDLTVHATEREGGIDLVLEYNTDLFFEESMKRMADHFRQLLRAVVDDPAQPVGRLKMLSAAEERQVLVDFNDTAADYPKDKTIIDLFEEQVRRTPGQIAVVFEDRSLTYKELNELSNQMARHIERNADLESGSCIGMLLERSEWAAISMIAIMKLGHVYVPIDTSLPPSRILYMLQDSGSKALVTRQRELQDGQIQAEGCIVIEADKIPAHTDASDLKRRIKGEDASYIIYTSGSTGNPKGVEQTHIMLYNLVLWDIHGAGMNKGQKHLQFSSFGFDSSLHDIYYCLCTGGEVHIINEFLRKDLWALKDYVLHQKIATLSMPYAALKAMFSEIPDEEFEGHHINEIVSTGEQLYISGGLRAFLEKNPAVRIYNLYGPSETHVVTGLYYSHAEGNIPEKALIGKPVHNTVIYILDPLMQPVPVGVEGEIYIGGWNLAKGYKGSPELTAQKFIPDPFRPGELLYRSGDIGKWLPGGDIEYIMRRDNQVKVNGYRIEPGEIETALRGYEMIEEAVVIIHQTEDGSKRLLAYLVSRSGLSIAGLQRYLAGILPSYMLPAYYIQLEKLPLTTNGKLDKRALPGPGEVSLSTGVEYVAPSGDAEEKLAEIWSEILGREKEKIGVRDNFFQTGGHSLLAIRLISRINREFDVLFPLKDIFSHPTIEGIAGLLGTMLWMKEPGDAGTVEDPDMERMIF